MCVCVKNDTIRKKRNKRELSKDDLKISLACKLSNNNRLIFYLKNIPSIA
jgi:hypothetical protein